MAERSARASGASGSGAPRAGSSHAARASGGRAPAPGPSSGGSARASGGGSTHAPSSRAHDTSAHSSGIRPDRALGSVPRLALGSSPARSPGQPSSPAAASSGSPGQASSSSARSSGQASSRSSGQASSRSSGQASNRSPAQASSRSPAQASSSSARQAYGSAVYNSPGQAPERHISHDSGTSSRERPKPPPLVLEEKGTGLPATVNGRDTAEGVLRPSSVSSVKDAGVQAVNGALLFSAHWFGARRFDYEDEQSQAVVFAPAPGDRVFSPHARSLAREQFMRGAGGTRRLDRRPHIGQELESGQAPTQGGVPGEHAAGSLATSEAGRPRDTLGVISEAAAHFVHHPRSDIKELVRADVKGQNVEKMMQQSYPIFILLQIAITFSLWVVFSIRDGTLTAVASKGLDSILPGRTDFAIHRDCEDFRPEVWRWLSYQFTHVSASHILMNAFLTFTAGVPLEGFHGHWRTVAVFNLGVFGGACSHVVNNIHAVSLVGMSAGCYSLMGMHLADLVMNWKQSRYRRVKLVLLMVLVLVDSLQAHFTYAQTGAEGAQNFVSVSSHAGGYGAGVIMGILLGRNVKVTRCEIKLMVFIVFLSVGCVTFSLAWVLQWAPRTIHDLTPWCWARQVSNSTVFGDASWKCVRCKSQACIDRWLHNQKVGYLTEVDFQQFCEGSYGWHDSEL